MPDNKTVLTQGLTSLSVSQAATLNEAVRTANAAAKARGSVEEAIEVVDAAFLQQLVADNLKDMKEEAAALY